jgi:hypothetical protein
MKGNTMPTDESIEFISNVHETLTETDRLMTILKTTVEVLEVTPGIPEESLVFSVALINNMTTLKVLVKELLEHSANMNDEMDKFVKEIENRITKK